MVNSRAIYAVIAILMIVIATVEASGNSYGDALNFIARTESSSSLSNCKGSIADCIAEEEEMEFDSEINRRILASKKYVSYGAMKKNSVPCSRRGASYYNCKRGAQANPYSRGCSNISRNSKQMALRKEKHAVCTKEESLAIGCQTDSRVCTEEKSAMQFWTQPITKEGYMYKKEKSLSAHMAFNQIRKEKGNCHDHFERESE